MPRFIRNLLVILRPVQRWQLLGLMLLALVTAALQVATVAAILPFVMLLLDPALAAGHPFLQPLLALPGFNLLDPAEPLTFILVMGSLVLLLLVVANSALALDLWLSLRFGYHLEHDLASRLLARYLATPWEQLRGRDLSELTRNVVNEVERSAVGTVLALLGVFNDVVITLFIAALLLLVDPIITLTTLGVLGVCYAAIYGLLQQRIDSLGKRLPTLNSDRLRSSREALSALRELRLAGAAPWFVKRFAGYSEEAATVTARYHMLEGLPVLLLETIAFAGLFIMAMVVALNSDGLSEFIPVIALYGLAAYRLVPAVKEVFSGMAEIRFNLPAFKQLSHDLQLESDLTGRPSVGTEAHATVQHLQLRDVSYQYPGRDSKALQHINLDLHPGERLCIMGPSGAGKSTLCDLVLGLITPVAGECLADGKRLEGSERLRWWQDLAWVSQQGIILEDSLAANIAFGVPEAERDPQRLQDAIEAAQLTSLIGEELAAGLDTRIGGHGGLRLSGGQQQRLLIARALYRDAHWLVLDEATSALDSATEQAFIEDLGKLLQLRPTLSLVCISHKPALAAFCERVILMREGRIVADEPWQRLADPAHPLYALALQGAAGNKL